MTSNPNIRAILIDDEFDSLESLKQEIELYCPGVEIVSSHSDPREGKKAIMLHEPDLLFLDIEMPYLNGFELLESLGEIRFDVIFITAYDEFAIKAFEFNASDYLLKPVIKSKLVQAVEKSKARKARGMGSGDLAALIHHVQLQRAEGMEKIALPTSEGFEFIHVNDIVYFKAESNYTWVHLVTGEKHLIARTLKQFSGFLSFTQLFRSHNSWIVNLNHVKKYIKGQGGYLVLNNGDTVPVSRSNKEGLINLLRI